MELFFDLLLVFLLVCAVAVSLSKNLLNSIIVYMSFSLIMSVIWILLESPDLAITEAAVGAGVTSILFIITLKKIHAIVKDEGKEGKAMILHRPEQNRADYKNMIQECTNPIAEDGFHGLLHSNREGTGQIQEESHE